MTQATQTVRQVGDYATRLLLTDLTIKMWTARKTDRGASDEVAASHGSDRDMGRYWKNLISPSRMEPLRKLATRAQAEHRDRTLPWLDSGARILLGAGYPAYAAAMRQYQADYQALVMTFLQEYDQAREEARVRLNGLFNDADYPPAHVVARKFDFSIDPLPFPSAADFRVDLSDDATAVIRETIEERTREALEAAQKDVWARVQAVVSKIVDRLGSYTIEADGSVSGIFRDSMIENTRELVGLLPTLNVTGDPTLDAVTDRMRDQLCKYDAQTLRDSEQARDETHDAAAEILDIVSQFM